MKITLLPEDCIPRKTIVTIVFFSRKIKVYISTCKYTHTHTHIYIYIYIYTHVYMHIKAFKNIYEGGLKTWLHHICCWWHFGPMGSKHHNIDGSSVWSIMWTTLKNKPHLVTFYESILVSLWTFQLTFICINTLPCK